jgi:hypothetical protein
MIPLALSVAIFDELTRHTCLETDNPLHLLLAAVGAADDDDLVHLSPWPSSFPPD